MTHFKINYISKLEGTAETFVIETEGTIEKLLIDSGKSTIVLSDGTKITINEEITFVENLTLDELHYVRA